MSTAPQKPVVQTGLNAGANDPQTPLSSRETDPNVLQNRASAPDRSVWVSASAGTGKTKVLTDRVLRLLLPREDGRPGTAAHRILCLTFTKAAASEMALRLSKTLASWAVTDKTALAETLGKLLGHTASDDEITAARRLFADVIDVPGGLKIMTIHAFCQSVLGRFPLEAGISPHFTVLEDAQTRELMERARAAVLTQAETDTHAPLAIALNAIAATINEDQFQALLSIIARERAQLARILDNHKDEASLTAAICAHLDIPISADPAVLLTEACADKAFAKDDLLSAARTMTEIGGKTDKDAADKILHWLATPPAQRPANIETYTSAFLTQKHQPRAKFVTKAVCEANPDIPDILGLEADRLLILREQSNAANTATLTRHLLTLGRAVLDEYEALKSRKAALDFDDLILQTQKLLATKDMINWVHYKLDQGLNHILIDEAQDTNPEQWQIAEALCEAFFHAAPDSETDRTVFVVGDEKQSIYSFQRASPEEFARMQGGFETRVKTAGQKWDAVPMDISFRSVKSVLEAVDAVFAAPAAHKGLGQRNVEHTAWRRGQAGLVELWPVFESDEGQTPDLWTPLIEPEDQQSGQKKLAVQISATIRGWIDNGETLESYNRAIRPGDIMILVRTRSKLVSQIARELKNNNLPVSGLDRMVLAEELAVQDLLAAAEFALQPRDDLTLACLLKSPLIGLDEDALLALAAGRGNDTLLSRIKDQQPALAEYLSAIQNAAANSSPFAFFSHLLRAPCPTDNISGRRSFMARLGKDAMDPIDELLNLARQHEQTETASLQRFVSEQKAQSPEIKRQPHAQANEIRIMTVHGAKGLQAPIVILPDTITTPAAAPGRAEKRLLWPNQTGLDIPLWSPRKDEEPQAYSAAMQTLDEKLEEEYRRLLYVAMTRAEDRLYIGGALNKKQRADNLPDGCWYALIQNGLERCETAPIELGGVRLSNPQSKDPDKTGKSDKKPPMHGDLPTWLRENLSAESQKSPIFRPSRALETSTSPLHSAKDHRFLRGNLTHKLLQILPECNAERRQTTSERFLEHYGGVLTPDIRAEITRETLDILNDPAFAAIFGPNSRAEVPITGKIEGKGLISGQIDRLCITDDEILIVDFKTNRPPPDNAADIPQIYIEQMQTYAAVLKQIYPGKPIRAALLWTDTRRLMPLDLQTV